VPAADVEDAVLGNVQKLLTMPELVARTRASAKREGEDEITEREVTVLLADFARVCSPPSRRGSCSCSSNGFRCRRMHWSCGSELRGSPA
jgi:hypothetical protein